MRACVRACVRACACLLFLSSSSWFTYPVVPLDRCGRVQEGLKSSFAQCSDITTFLRDNTFITKLIGAYTQREPAVAVRWAA